MRQHREMDLQHQLESATPQEEAIILPNHQGLLIPRDMLRHWFCRDTDFKPAEARVQ